MGILTARVLVLAALVVSAALAPSPAQAQNRLDEHQVKAAFLYNFAKFVQWPAGSQTGPLVIGVVGDGLFGNLIDQIVNGKTVQGREIVVRQLEHADDLGSCHILFIAGSEARHTAALLQRLEGMPVLTVGETLHFLREGGIARFFVDRNRVRFEINPSRAEYAKLKISSPLLSLAQPVSRSHE